MLYVVLILLSVVICFWVSIRIRAKREERIHRLETLIHIQPLVEAALDELISFYSYSHFITESERIALNEKYTDLFKEVSSIISCKELEESPHKESILRFYNAMSDSQGHKKANNDHFIENQLIVCSRYFDTVLSYPLDGQQRESVLSQED
ncbi:MAG: hypothetical protein IJQ93_05350, partial [Bacteroidales bacterium]|nr:hypothetical protein [Bacteroidales bacterium]